MDGVFNVNDDEINVEGFALEFTARFPLEEPAACWNIHKLIAVYLEESLKSRAARHAPKPESPS